MPKYRVFMLLLICFLLVTPITGCGSSGPKPADKNEPHGIIVISGAFALYPMMQRWAEEFRNEYPYVQFDISAGGAGKGMTDAVSGAVDIGMVSRDIKPEEIALGAYGIGVTKDAVFPVINQANPVIEDIMIMGIDHEILFKIFISGEIKTWGEVIGNPDITEEIHIYTRSDACGAAEMWSKFLGDNQQEDLLGIGINADPGLLEAVLKDPLGIGYNNLGYLFEPVSGKIIPGAVVVPIDLNSNSLADEHEIMRSMPEAVEAIASGSYPSPPARELYLVTKDKPEGITRLFIHWILTEGQKYVGEAGYVQLSPEQITDAIKLVD